MGSVACKIQPEKLLPLKVFQAQEVQVTRGDGHGVSSIADGSRFRKPYMYGKAIFTPGTLV